MINAMVNGRIVHIRETGESGRIAVTGRIVLDNDRPVQITAYRGTVRRALLDIQPGMPVSVSGRLTTTIRHTKEGDPYVALEIEVSSVMTPQPSFLTRIFN